MKNQLIETIEELGYSILTEIYEKNTTGFIPLYTESSYNRLREIKSLHYPKKKAKFLDLGSGIGMQVAIAGNLGFNAYGIEINKYIEAQSKRLFNNLEQKGFLKRKNLCQTAFGSYFPEEYIRLRQQGKSLAVKIEKEEKIKIGGHSHFFPLSSKKNPYKKLGIQPKDIDLFFAYTWRSQLPSVLEFFSLYSKKDAKLLLFPAGKPKNYESFLHSLNLESKDFSSSELITKFS